MANDFTIKVRVQGGADVDAVKKALEGLGATVQKTRGRVNEADRSQQDFFDTQKKGIIGTANSTKSFSKLAETLGNGGSSGLVGAYATLAANIFAVTAAFNALRNASQVEQIFRGLEASGARTGLSLNSTAKALREVTGAAISTEQAMRSTAQITSAGFSGETVERLGKAARDASFALGRNMTDSLDRLSRGVVKLEPELLDELGIMTKLTESNVRYAQQLGKTESQLSNFEKRQGFLNAVIAEAELKFGGLSAAAGDSTAYDRLAATFSDLTTQIMNVANVIAKPLAGALASSSTLILGLLISFGSTLKNQLLPGLAGSAAAANRSAAAMKELAVQKLEAAQAARDLAAAEQRQNLSARASADFLSTRGAKVYRENRDNIKATITDWQNLTREQAKGVNSLRASIRQDAVVLANNANFARGTDAGDAKRRDRVNSILELRALRELANARRDAATFDVENENKVVAARQAAMVATKQAAAQEAAAASIGAASQLNLKEGWKQLRLSVGNYAAAQALASNAGYTGMARVRTAVFAATTATKMLGTAFLTALPWIGLIVTGIGLLKGAWEGLKSDAVKEMEKSLEAFNERAQKAVQYGNEIARANASLIAPSTRAAAALTIQSNAVREISEAYEDLVKKRAAVDQEGVFKNLLDGLNGNDAGQATVASFWETIGKRSAMSYNLGIKKNSKLLDLGDSVANFAGNLNAQSSEALQALNNLNEAAPRDLDKWVIKNYGSWKNLNATVARSPKLLQDIAMAATKDLNKALGEGAERIKSFQEAFKQLESDFSDFYRSAAISTPFDAVVKSVSNANNSIMALATTYKNSGEDWKALLTGLDANTTSGLSVSLQKDIQAFKQADTVVQSLVERQKTLNSNVDERTRKAQELTAIEQRSLEINRATVAGQGALVDRIIAELAEKERVLVTAQAITRQNASQLSLLQAQISANGNIYKAGAAGLRAKLQDEDKVRSIQKQQLQIQIDVLKSSSALNESKMAGLRISIQENDQLVKSLELINKVSLESQKANFAKKGIGADVLATLESRGWGGAQLPALLGREVDTDTKREVNSYLEQTKTIKDTNEELIKQRVELRAAEQASRDILASIKSLSTQIAAIDASALSNAEKAAAYQRAELEFRSGSLTALRAQEKTLVDINAIYRESDSIINGTSNTLTGQIKLLSKSADDQKQALRNEYTDKLRELDTALREARAQRSRAGLSGAQRKAADALVNSAQESLTIAQRGLELELQRVDAQQQLNVLQKTFFDTQTQGLQWQQDALELTRKRLDAQKNLRDEVLKENELRVRLAAKRNNYDVNPSGEQALEIRAAAEAYRFAVEESKVKKTMIDLEFALLDAQRQQLREELVVRREAAVNSGDADRVAQLDSVIQNLDVNLTAVASAAKKAVDRNIENLQLTLKTALTIGRRGEESFVANFRAAAEGFKQIDAAREAAKDTTVAIPLEVKSAEIVARKTGEAINPLISSNTTLIQSIRDWIAVIDKQIGTYRKGSENLSGFTDAKSVGTFIKSLGFNVTENQNFGGVTRGAHKGRGHAEGRAFDVSLGAGNADVNNPQFKARTIAMARELAKQGLTTLFDGIKYAADGESKYPKSWGAHRDHAHVEIPRGWKPADIAVVQQAAAEKMSETLQTGATKAAEKLTAVKPAAQAVTPADDQQIVVNGARPPKQPEYQTPQWIESARIGMDKMDQYTAKTVESLKQLGPQGEVVSSLYNGMMNIGSSFLYAADTINEFGATSLKGLTAVAQVASSVLSTVQSVVSSVAAAKEEAIEREITAEQRRDGKSAESVAKIAALEKRKDEIARKTFNTNKKLMMAQAVISTATGVATALSIPFIGIPLAAAIGALGAAQIAIIAGTSYQSAASSSAGANITTPTLTIGKRGDSVDLAKQNSNVGGEIGYLRGRQGVGSNSSNYSVIGSAYGAKDLFRGYGNSSFVLGEKGPETLTPETPITVRPASDGGQPTSLSAEFHVSALDASGVEDLLLKQKGNIISMLREAANSTGKPFMEEVNVNVYSSPNKTGGTKL